MNRRTYLSTTALLATAGCLTTQTTADDADDGAPTVRTTTTATFDGPTLGFGEWYESDEWALTATDVALRIEFQHADRGTTQMPDDEQLLYAALRLKNLTQESRRALGIAFLAALEADGTAHEAVRDFSHPEFDHGVGVYDLEQVPVTGSRLKGMNREEVASGEIVRRWFVAVVPRVLAGEDAVVGFDDPFASGEYPARWQE